MKLFAITLPESQFPIAYFQGKSNLDYEGKDKIKILKGAGIKDLDNPWLYKVTPIKFTELKEVKLKLQKSLQEIKRKLDAIDEVTTE